MSEFVRTTTPSISTARPLVSELGWSTADSITSYGYDLPNELIGTVNAGAMGFLGLAGRLPTRAEDRVVNALHVVLIEHGQTPSAIAARPTILEQQRTPIAAEVCTRVDREVTDAHVPPERTKGAPDESGTS